MDDKSAKAATGKADAVVVKVGYPLSPDTLSARSIYEYYRLMSGKPDNFLGNLLSAKKRGVYKKWQKLREHRNRDEWKMWPSVVSAYYDYYGNEIVFPAGILQPPFFNKDWYVHFACTFHARADGMSRPGYLNYGAFGMVAAHELTHAFDSIGRMFNQEGKIEQWWTNQTVDGFRGRQECVSKQYSSMYPTMCLLSPLNNLSPIRILHTRP
jgi:endothelin-converting enzyme